ncbi:hypothetical protein DESUT3_08370 [Desulfuromonas versatilis]|uniref:NlpC/P60 domain-containing protein n=1 Tax=Desulfuromonas versatilis TaxID=2802975 RepID=A0ABM8HPT1_9BACT|nr:C40 family peptidase [Desulfuromonas versatilis]BCR03768.1 hypothetical protein DESUT3_08370 [Desulfuromonas versatilis]
MTAASSQSAFLHFLALLLAASLLASGCAAPVLQSPPPEARNLPAWTMPDWALPGLAPEAWKPPLQIPATPPRRTVRLLEPSVANQEDSGDPLQIEPPPLYPEFSLEPSPEELIGKILDDTGLQVMQAALEQMGAPYASGGSSPKGFDCSGLVHYAYSQIGLDVPRSSQELYKIADKVDMTELQPGDLVFFRIYRRRISHVGIFVGEDRFVHAPSRGKRVSISSLEEPYWSRHLVGAGRLR